MTAESPETVDDAPYVRDDPNTDQEAWVRFVRALVKGVVVGIPVVLGAAFALIRAVSDATTEEALVMAAWTAFWGGVFAGGAAATMAFTARQEHD